MESIEQLQRMVSEGADVRLVRRAIVTFLRRCLSRGEGPMDAWTLGHLVNAVGALSLNVNALQQPSSAWLRLCVTDLAQAMLPAEQRDAQRRDGVELCQIDWVTSAWLHDMVDTIAAEIERPPMPPVVRHRMPVAGAARFQPA